MNNTYSQDPYRPPGPGAYSAPPMHNPQYNQMPASRPPVPESEMHPSDALQPLQPLQPGTQSQPAVRDSEIRSCIENGWKYELSVVQQPQRARMCGFGDKDRRPITPPPCVRLIITDVKTGKECDVNDIDHGMFVLNVDLWSADGIREVNLVRHSQNSPSISLTTPVSYGQIESGHAAFSHILPGAGGQVKFEQAGGPAYGQPSPYPNSYSSPPQVIQYSQQPPPQQVYGGQQYHPGYTPAATSPQYPPQNGYNQQGATQQNMYYPGAPMHAQAPLDFAPATQSHASQNQMGQYGARPSYSSQEMAMQRMPASSTQPGGMFTRNLIGSLAASAFRLTDPDDRIGIWFVLQDLSVRTEGTFRLRFSFVNVGLPNPPQLGGGSSNGSHAISQVNQGKAPVLASCFSECFTVYSAKRFPGVVESTSLSKCFATQGIKIPIRKDGQGPGTRQSDRDKEYEDD